MPTARFACLALAALTAIATNLTSARADILVSLYESHSVARYDETTFSLTPTGQIPPLANGLMVPQGLAVTNNTIYVSGAVSGKVQRYDLAGNFLGNMQNFADDGVPLFSPSSINVGPNGNVFVADFVTNGILEFLPSGQFVGVAATLDSTPGGFTWAENGDLIAGELFGSLKKFSGGTATELLPGVGGFSPASLLRLAGGDLLIANLFGNNILRYEWGTGMTSVFATIEHPLPPGSVFPDPSFPSNGPASLIFDRDGNILVGVAGPDHNFTGQVQKYDLNGNYLGTLIDGLGAPTGLALIPVPEPSTWLLAVCGAAGVAFIARRRKAAQR